MALTMSEKTVSDLIFEKFLESINDDDLFKEFSAELVAAMREKQGKTKIKELMRKRKNETPQP
jgi:hypothetical protein